MAILTIHHWDAEQEAGVRELRRVARGPVVVLTMDSRVTARMWLMADYLHEGRVLEERTFPRPETLAAWLGGDVEIVTLPYPRDSPDWMLASFWAHPERVLDPVARANTSGFARIAPEVVDRVVGAVAADLADGTWERRHGHLRELDAHDVGMCLVVAR